MSLVVNGILYTDATLETMSTDQLRELCFAEAAEQEVLAAAQAAPGTKTEFQKQEIIKDSLAASIPLPKLKALAEAETMEEIRQAELAEKQQHIAEAELEKKFENVKTEDIPGLLAEEKERLEIAASPEGQVQAELDSAEQRLADAAFVAEQIEHSNSKQLDNLVARKVAEAVAERQQSDATQENFVATHPDYVAIPQNANALTEFIRGAGFSEFTEKNLDLAYTILKQRGQLVLKDQKTVQQEQQIREQVINPKPVRKSSSVSSSASGNFHTPKPAPTEEDLYDPEKYSLADIKRLADADARRRGEPTDDTIVTGGRL